MDTACIWNAFNDNMRRFLLKQVHNPQDADDLLQEIFIKIHLKSDSLRKEESLPAWIWQLTRNTVLDYHKKRRLRIAPQEAAALLPAEMPETNVNQLLAECIRPYLELMDPEKREALELADLNRISQKVLADKWGISYSGAKSRVQRAREELYGLFQQCCYIKSDAYGNIIFVECMEEGGS